jgi:hypothetical protein
MPTTLQFDKDHSITVDQRNSSDDSEGDAFSIVRREPVVLEVGRAHR